MATSIFPCGCMILQSMFGNRELLQVITCPDHAVDHKIQAAMVVVAGLILEAVGTPPTLQLGPSP